MKREPTPCKYCLKPVALIPVEAHEEHCPRRREGHEAHSPAVVAFTALLVRQWAEDGQTERRTGR